VGDSYPVERPLQASVTKGTDDHLALALRAFEFGEPMHASCGCRAGKEKRLEKHDEIGVL
jgi:hypothetical protein